MVMPGDNLKFEVELIAPIAMEDGLRFAIREGGRTVGAGVPSSPAGCNFAPKLKPVRRGNVVTHCPPLNRKGSE
jgi:hypothetical protein